VRFPVIKHLAPANKFSVLRHCLKHTRACHVLDRVCHDQLLRVMSRC
jgi:hypothetical protein